MKKKLKKSEEDIEHDRVVWMAKRLKQQRRRDWLNYQLDLLKNTIKWEGVPHKANLPVPEIFPDRMQELAEQLRKLDPEAWGEWADLYVKEVSAVVEAGVAILQRKAK